MGNEKTEEKTELGPELTAITGTRTPLAKVVPIDESRVDLFNPRKWGREDIEVIKKTVCPAGIPDADFKLFIMKCQASGMNPLLGEAFCIKRNQNIGTKDNPKWIEVFQFTPGEQGMEGRADDFPDFRGLRAAAVYENDKILIDSSAGEVSHQWNPVDKNRGRLVGAWALAYREGRKTPAEYVRLEEYFDMRNPKWTSSPATMLVKCARAAALRRAYPNTFDGVFVREEIRDDVVDGELTASQAADVNRDTTDRLADRMKQTAKKQDELKTGDASRAGAVSVPTQASKATIDVVPTAPPKEEKPPQHIRVVRARSEHDRLVEEKALAAKLDALGIGYDGERLAKDDAYFAALTEEADKQAKRAAGAVSGGTMDRAAAAGPAPVEEKLPHQVADEKKAADGPLMVFGPADVKGKPIKSLDGPKLLEMIGYGEEKISQLDEAKAKKVRACIDLMKKEMEARDKALTEDATPPEPGSDFDVD